jgi:1-acyl-sn-glycerol-3-phosphate acyltransferase
VTRAGRVLRAGTTVVIEGAGAFLHGVLRVVAGAAARVYFRRLRVVGGERLPARGPAILVANHPAAWTDVVVLDAALGRRLHFLAQESLFHPWARAALLHIHGSIPVRQHDSALGPAADNRASFARCHALLDQGEVIVVFPEGVSESDRTVGPLKTGAARLALEHDARGATARVVPIGIHYEDRMAFRSTVTLAVGPDVSVHRAPAGSDPRAAAHALTEDVRVALEAALTTAAAAARDRATGAPPEWQAVLVPFAHLGRALHAVPVLAIERAARALTGLPARLAFGRILFGLALIPAWYGLLLAGALALGGGAWLAIPLATPALGWLACLDRDRRRATAGAQGAAP